MIFDNIQQHVSMINQGKLLINEHAFGRFLLGTYLVWSLKPMAQNYFKYKISLYLFISILCANSEEGFK